MKRGPTYRCPRCIWNINCHECVNGPPICKPNVGDVLICARCWAVMEVVDDRGLARLLSEEEIAKLPEKMRETLRAVVQHTMLIKKTP